MKKLVLGLMMLIAFSVFAQNPTHTVDFEPAGVGAGWSWTTFEFAPSLSEIANPVPGGINSSANVIEFIAHVSDQPWTGCWTEDDGQFTFDVSNSIIKIMVFKPIISEVHFKVEGGTGAVTELVASNTVVNAWEELTFDFSSLIGQTYSRLVIFPDFNFARVADVTLYFDNIQVPDGVIVGPLPEPTTVPTTPPHAAADVISIYSDAYANLPGTAFNPNWGQSTAVTVDYVAAGNNTLKYENLNYQGTQFTNQDVSLYEYIHVDFWTPNATDLNFFLISPGAEISYSFLPFALETWVSVDIPLSAFVPPVNLSNVFQFKVTGNQVVYFDNWYFWKNPVAPGSDATLSDLTVDGTTVAGFSPATLNYNVELPYGTTLVPLVDAIPTDEFASYVVNPAASLPGTTSVVVTAQNLTTTLTYNVNFTLAGPEPTTVPPTPTHAPENVISIYSDAYSNLPGVNYNPWWGQSTLVTVDYVAAGNNTLKYENLNYQGTEFTNQDVSGYENLHVDFWTANSTNLSIYLISPGPVETPYAFSITIENWVSIDIPLSAFAPVNLADVFQFKVVGDGDVFFDNLYFWKSPVSSSTIWNGNIDNNWHDAGNWDSGIPGSSTDVTIPAGLSNYPTIGSAASCNNIILGSTAASTATLLDNGFLTVNGSTNVERYFTGNTTDWHLVSSPISNATAGVFSGMYLQRFDETTNVYTEISDENTPLDAGSGYAVYSTLGIPNTVAFSGTMNNGIQPMGFTAINQGWNLLGNPFVSSIDWENVIVPAGMSTEVHYIDAASGNDLSYVQGVGGTGSQFVPPMQGFFVKATGAGTLTLDDAARSHAGAGTFYKDYNPNLLVLEASGAMYTDQAWIHFNNQAGVEHDGIYDAYKRISLSNPTLPQLFSITPGGSYLSINGMPEVGITSLGFTAVESGLFTIAAVETGEFANVYLLDLINNSVTNLLSDSYTFNYSAGDPIERFELHFETLSIDSYTLNNISIYSLGHDIHVNLNENLRGQMSVYNAMGQQIISSSLNEVHTVLNLKESGFYIVSVNVEGHEVSEKIFIK